jgi:AraC-like DNA-binding protein
VHVSVGHLHRLFRDTGTTVNRSLVDLRVQRCAADLRDPRLRHRSVAEIAYGRGFKDAAHFTRAFAARHGTTPSDWRAAAPAARPGQHRMPGA